MSIGSEVQSPLGVRTIWSQEVACPEQAAAQRQRQIRPARLGWRSWEMPHEPSESSNVGVFVADFPNRKLMDRGQGPLNDLPDDYDVLSSGVPGLLAFVEMMMAAGEHFVGEINIENLNPEKMTIIVPCSTAVGKLWPGHF